jgi:hypothetical protein
VHDRAAGTLLSLRQALRLPSLMRACSQERLLQLLQRQLAGQRAARVAWGWLAGGGWQRRHAPVPVSSCTSVPLDKPATRLEPSVEKAMDRAEEPLLPPGRAKAGRTVQGAPRPLVEVGLSLRPAASLLGWYLWAATPPVVRAAAIRPQVLHTAQSCRGRVRAGGLNGVSCWAAGHRSACTLVTLAPRHPPAAARQALW